MELITDFNTFLAKIRLTDHQIDNLRDGHNRLRERLSENEDLNSIKVSDFLQGSYRRHTAVKPKNDNRADVDIIVVTNLSEDDYSPDQAMDLFVPFLNKWYSDKWRRQGRSFGIELSAVDFDLVVTSAPSEMQISIFQSDAITTPDDIIKALDWRLHPSWLSLATRTERSDAKMLLAEASKEPEWQLEPLRIPNREAGRWEDTHPLEQICWTRDKNAATDGHFVNVVKAIKWWRLENYKEPKHPKGFPLERIVGDCCPDGIGSIAEGITLTLENIVSRYGAFVSSGSTPVLPDYGVPSHDVLSRITSDDFTKFYNQAQEGAEISRAALSSSDRQESSSLWRELLGSQFPLTDNGGSNKDIGFTPPSGPAVPDPERFA